MKLLFVLNLTDMLLLLLRFDDLRMTKILLIFILWHFINLGRNTNRRFLSLYPNSSSSSGSAKFLLFLDGDGFLLDQQRGMTWTHIVGGFLGGANWAPLCYERSLVRLEDLLALYYGSHEFCLAIPIFSDCFPERWSAKGGRDLGGLVDKLILRIDTVIVGLLCLLGSIVRTVVLDRL